MLKIWKDKWKSKHDSEISDPQHGHTSTSKHSSVEILSPTDAENTLTELYIEDYPSDAVLVYDPPFPPSAGRNLLQELHLLDPLESSFGRIFKASRYVLGQLGSCASDLVWRRALGEIEAAAPSWYEDDDEQTSPAVIKAKIRDTVKNWIFTMPNLDTGSRGCNVTPKLLRLFDILKACQSHGDNFCGIIFVHKRALAVVLVELIRSLSEIFHFIRPSTLVDHHFVTHRNQLETLRSFTDGTHNLLVSTKSMADLDMPRASTVICFDIFDDQFSQACIRSCARGPDGHIIHMVQRGNYTHGRILANNVFTTKETKRWMDSMYRRRLNVRPTSSLPVNSESYHSDSDDEDEEYLSDPTTGGRIYPQDATAVFFRFASTVALSHNRRTDEHPLFKFNDDGGDLGRPRAYVCRIILPGTPVDGLQGSSSVSTVHSRRVACYRACEWLTTAGFLDYSHFLSPVVPPRTRLQSFLEDNQLPPPSDKFVGTRVYPKQKPQFWTFCKSTGLTCPVLLYPTIISIKSSDNSIPSHAPILFLTWDRLPELANFRMFFSGAAVMLCLTRGEAFEVDKTRLHELYLYTLRVCRSIANKPFACVESEVKYFIAPLPRHWTPPQLVDRFAFPKVADQIPWDLVNIANTQWAVPLKFGKAAEVAEDIDDAVVQDRWTEFTRRYIVTQLRTDLTPLSKPQETARAAKYESLVDYCKARRKGFEGLKDYNQPIIQVSKLQASGDPLNPSARSVSDPSESCAKYFIPELCNKLTIPASTFRTTLLLPSILRRIDEFLLVKELNAKILNHAVSEDLLHMSISPPSAGIEYDYERLEMLGDAFLKYLSSIYVFLEYSTQGEGALHIARQPIISNKALLQSANSVGLPPFIQGRHFPLKGWLPPNFTVESVTQKVTDRSQRDLVENDPLDAESQNMSADNSQRTIDSSPISTGDNSPAPLSAEGSSDSASKDDHLQRSWRRRKQLEERSIQYLGDKAVADVAEAVIGAAYMTGGPDVALKITKILNIPVLNVGRWADFAHKYSHCPETFAPEVGRNSILAIEKIIGHKFRHPHLLGEAITVESSSYERLEFIGDAVLEFTVIRHLFDNNPQLSPGGLTMLKGAMVSNSTLAAICALSGLADHLLCQTRATNSVIQEYSVRLHSKRTQELEMARLERRAPGQFWVDLDPPKVLSDSIESIVGALYISEDCTSVGCDRLFHTLLKPFYDLYISLKTLSHHPTKILYELVQARGCRHLQLVKEEAKKLVRCIVLVHDVILASAEDATYTLAVRQACLAALDAMEGDSEFLNRTCDCRIRQGELKENAFHGSFHGLEEVKDLFI